MDLTIQVEFLVRAHDCYTLGFTDVRDHAHYTLYNCSYLIFVVSRLSVKIKSFPLMVATKPACTQQLESEAMTLLL